MSTIISLIRVFIVGGLICAIGQLLIDRTKLSSARILVIFVITGVILTAVGFYPLLVKYAGAGATVPLTGFGYTLAKGVFKEIDRIGVLGAFTGGVKAVAGGIAAAIFFAFLASVTFSPKAKQ